jgi:hypothetical protein
MFRRICTPGQIINKPREVEIFISQGVTTGKLTERRVLLSKLITAGVESTEV